MSHITALQIELANVGRDKLTQTLETILAAVEQEKRESLRGMLNELHLLLDHFTGKPSEGSLFTMARIVRETLSLSKKQIPLPPEIQKLIDSRDST